MSKSERLTVSPQNQTRPGDRLRMVGPDGIRKVKVTATEGTDVVWVRPLNLWERAADRLYFLGVAIRDICCGPLK